jgi:hypothetical protein
MFAELRRRRCDLGPEAGGLALGSQVDGRGSPSKTGDLGEVRDGVNDDLLKWGPKSLSRWIRLEDKGNTPPVTEAVRTVDEVQSAGRPAGAPDEGGRIDGTGRMPGAAVNPGSRRGPDDSRISRGPALSLLPRLWAGTFGLALDPPTGLNVES